MSARREENIYASSSSRWHLPPLPEEYAQQRVPVQESTNAYDESCVALTSNDPRWHQPAPGAYQTKAFMNYRSKSMSFFYQRLRPLSIVFLYLFLALEVTRTYLFLALRVTHTYLFSALEVTCTLYIFFSGMFSQRNPDIQGRRDYSTLNT